MNGEGRLRARSLSVLLALSMLLSVLSILAVSDQATGTVTVIAGDWEVTGTDNVFDGIVFKVDGNVNVTSGAVLEIRNGRLVFLQDSNHLYTLHVKDGASGHGTLILDNSVLTTEPNQLEDHLKLDVIVEGTLVLRNGSTMKHPGTLTTSGDAVVEIHDSVITGFEPEEIADFTLDVDGHDDAPVMDFGGSSSVLFANSVVSRLYENASDPGPNDLYNLTVRGTATLTVIDSFVGVDFLESPTEHNVIAARDSSRVYLYGMTLDQEQSDTANPSDWVPALVPVGTGAAFYIHRWLDVQVTDRFGAATPGAHVEARVLPTGTQLASFPDNGDANVPGSTLLEYLGKTALDWNVTDATGRARLPLLTEWINASTFEPTMPNSHFLGNYRIRASFQGEAASTDLSFSAYPALTEVDNTLAHDAQLTDLVWPAQANTYDWNEPLVIDYDLEMDGNVWISAEVRLVDAHLRIVQGDLESGRHYLIVEGTGSLVMEGGRLSSNLPLVVYLRDSGQLVTTGTELLLNTPAGRGVIYSEHSSIVDLRDGRLEGDLQALGGSASLRNMAIADSSLTFNNSGVSSLWTPTFQGTVGLALLSDPGDVNTLAFDIRNVTFPLALSPFVIFRGTQFAQLTNVTFPEPGDWWTGRIFDDAKVSLSWWLTLQAVDGVGDPVSEVNFTLRRLNPQTMTFQPIPVPGPDDLFHATYVAGTLVAPEGVALYRALAQERLASQGWSNSTYRANASVDVDEMTFYAEAEPTATVNDNTVLDLVLFNWPDLRIEAGEVTFSRPPVEGGLVEVQVTVHNDGKADAVGATVELYDNGVLVEVEEVDVPLGESVPVNLTWRPEDAGPRTLTIWALTRNDTKENTDLDLRNNRVDLTVDVLTKPDLELRPEEYDDVTTVKGRSFTVQVVVYNTGSTAASNFDVGLFLDEVSPENLLALRVGLTVPGGGSVTLLMESEPVDVVGNYTLIVLVDVNNVIPEDDKTNNRVEVLLRVVPPEGSVFVLSPAAGASYNLGDQVFVSGSVTTPTGQPIPDMRVTLTLRDPEGTVWDIKAIFTNQLGEYVVGLQIPADGISGTWAVSAEAEAATIESATVLLNVAAVVPWHLQVLPVVGLPVWMLVAILALFVLVVLGMGAYMRAFGLGRLVECGECGAFIKESAASCPKCGTEFEAEMAKCSSCHAWIPAEVKKCPECGVEFTTGKSKAVDYKERMRKQYEKIVNKYRAEAARALGHRPSEKEFQEWWRRQPTFVPFEQWLKEEEEMRKMGSKACPRCNALNSITATLCHRCGTLMAGDAPKGRGPPPGGPGPGGPGKGGGGPVPRPPMPPPGGAGAAKGDERKAVLKKIVKKPFAKKE